MLRLARFPGSPWLVAALVFEAVVVGAGGAVAAVSPAQEDVQRVLTLLAVVGEEYREGFDAAGALVRPLEYEEARSFLAEARQRWDHLEPAGGGGAVAPQLAALAAQVDAKAPVDTVLAGIAAARADVTAQTGVDEVVYPPQP